MFFHNHKKALQCDQQALCQVGSSILQFPKILDLKKQLSKSCHQVFPSESMKINIICPCCFNCFQIPQKQAMSVRSGSENSHSWNHLLYHITQWTCLQRSWSQHSQDEAMAVWHTSLGYWLQWSVRLPLPSLHCKCPIAKWIHLFQV